MNKYALGTIVGTALLGLAKKQVGSNVKLKMFYDFTPGTLSNLPVILTDPSKLTESVVKNHCQGNKKMNDLINGPIFSTFNEETQQEIIMRNESHDYCSKNESNECISFLPPNQNEVKKAAEKILKLIIELNKEEISITRIRDTDIEIEDNASIYQYEKIERYKRLNKNILIIKKPYKKWHEYNLKNLCDLIVPQILSIGYFTIRMSIPFTGIIRLNHHPNTDEGKKDLSNEIYKIIDEVVHPFGFTSDKEDRPYDFNLNFNYLTTSHLMIKKDDEWVLYDNPESTLPKLRKR